MTALPAFTLRALPLLLVLVAINACAPTALPGSIDPTDGGAAIDLGRGGVMDLAGADLADTSAWFTGLYAWDLATAVTVCDDGGRHTDTTMGDFPLKAGPGARQVNIGAGTGACPIFLFDVSGGVATLSGAGVTCKSGPGSLTTHSGSLTTSDAGNTLAMLLVLDAQEPGRAGGLVHCTITVSGISRRKFH